MKISKKRWLNILLIIIGVLFIRLYSFITNDKKDEIIINNIHIQRKPLISQINSVFGKGVDSSRACDCIIPKFYMLIEKDELLVNRLKQSGNIFDLQGPLYDSFKVVFTNCIKVNISDTAYNMPSNLDVKLELKQKLKKKFILQNGLDSITAENLSNCLAERLNGNITIGEWLSDNYPQIPKIEIACEEVNIKNNKRQN